MLFCPSQHREELLKYKLFMNYIVLSTEYVGKHWIDQHFLHVKVGRELHKYFSKVILLHKFQRCLCKQKEECDNWFESVSGMYSVLGEEPVCSIYNLYCNCFLICFPSNSEFLEDRKYFTHLFFFFLICKALKQALQGR